MFCRICGKQIPDHSAFCSNCGTAQVKPVQAPPSPAAPPQFAPQPPPYTAPPPPPYAAPQPPPYAAPPLPPQYAFPKQAPPQYIPYTPPVAAPAPPPAPEPAPPVPPAEEKSAEPAVPTLDETPAGPVSGVAENVVSPKQPVFAPMPPAAAAKRQRNRKKSVAAILFAGLSVLLAAALALSLTGLIPPVLSGLFGGATAAGPGAASISASRSFASPEEAAEGFVACLKTGDFDGALGACAVGRMASGFDYQKYAERLMALTPVGTANLPALYSQYVRYNEYRMAADLMRQMACFSISFSLSDDHKGLIDGTMVVLKDGSFPGGLLDELNPAQLSSLEIVEIAKTRLHDSVQNRENQQKMAAVYGAEDIQYRAVLYKLDGSYYVGGFTLIQYDGGWQVQSMNDPIMGIPVSGVPFPVSGEEEFTDLLG